MFQKCKRLCLLIAAMLLSACASVPMVDPTDTSRSVIFGYLDMADADADLDWVYAKNYGGTGGYTISAEDGLFYHVAVGQGPYQIIRFGGSGFLAGDVIYSFPETGRNETAIVIDRPGAYFAGSHKYVEVETGFLEQSKFDIKTMTTPSEKTVLQQVLQKMRKTNPEYQHAIRLVERRLAEL